MALTETDVKIIIAAELRKQGFDKAKKATDSLDKTFKNLARTIGITFSAAALVNFAKKSVKAFEEDEKAARRLTQTLSNMGLAFEDPRMKSFISNLEATSGVLDDKLRPAMQSLLTTTGSVAKSQELLTLALDVAAGSGEDVVTVAQDLSRAYVGNTKGLAKYNLGLSRAELQSKSFAEVQALIAKQFSGQNAAYLETYSGKVAMLNVAYANLQETVGKSLVEAFSLLAGKDGIGGATKALEDFGTQIADTITGISLLINNIKGIPGVTTLLSGLNMSNFGILGVLQALGEKNRTAPKPFSTPMTVSGQTDLYSKQDAARKKAELEAAKRAKALAALQTKAAKDAAKREREAQMLKRAGTVFDMENIQVVAALQGKVTEEQRLRLIALLAINNDNAEAADKLTSAILALQGPAFKALGVTIETSDNASTVIEKLISAQTKLFLLNSGIANIPKAKNPFEDWLAIMDAIIKKLDAISTKIKTLPSAAAASSTSSGTTVTTVTGGGGGGGVGGGTVIANPVSTIGSATTVGSVISAIDSLTTLRADTTAGSPISILLKEQIDTLTNSLTLSSLSYLSDEQAKMRAMGVFDTPGIVAGSRFDPSAFRRGEMGQSPIVVYVQGSVITEQDLASTITDIQYQYQKAGQDIRVSSTNI
ncbi:MAG: hypothetical protein EB015_13340 [Methylocystaceae bacterium]|nr:hypothetical protein [Methylocystaceae bacterium]